MALVSMKFVPPTAMSEGGLWHRGGLMHAANGSQEAQHTEMKHMLAKAKSPWLSRRQQQTLYMVATNAMPIGKRISRQQRCATCGAPEYLGHVLFHCATAVEFWKMVLPHWARHTPQQKVR